MEIVGVDFWGENELVAGGMDIHWQSAKKGWGTLRIFKEYDGKLVISTERMDDGSKTFVKGMIEKALREAVITD